MNKCTEILKMKESNLEEERMNIKIQEKELIENTNKMNVRNVELTKEKL